MHYSARDQIRNIFVIFASAIACAMALVAFMIHSFGPSGVYEVRNVLIAPDTLAKLSYTDSSARFEFDHLEFTYNDARSNRIVKVPVEAVTYRKLWSLVEQDKSSRAPGQAVEALFGPQAATLLVWVRSPQASPHVLQQVQFVPSSDYYRVQLYDPQATEQWAYFEHPGIYELTMKQLASHE